MSRESRTTRPLAGFDEVCRELDRRRHVTLGLDRIEALLSLLGGPHKSLKVVQVVGTNGKGTTTVALAAALEAVGLAAGAYLSPHVLSYTERVMLRGRYVSEEHFAAAMGEAIAVSDAHGVEASQFELLTAGALKLFADEGLAWAVLEAGLGARYDATTAAEPEAVVLTNVGLDHTEYLGETVAEISREKLASLSPGSILVLGTRDPTVVAAARERCEEVGARLVEAAPEGEGVDLAAAGLPPYAARDAELGMRAAEALLGRVLSGGERGRVLDGVVGALPGRFEVGEVGAVPVVADGGHNPDGVDATLEAVGRAFAGRPAVVVFGVLQEKDAASMLCALEGEAHALVLTRAEGERAVDPVLLEREYGPRDRSGRRAVTVEDPVEAVRRAIEEAREVGGVVLVTGSLGTVAPVLRWLREW